jgi:hypothetical protein
VIGGLLGALVPRWPYEVEYAAAVALALLLAWHLARWQSRRPSCGGAVLLGCLLFEGWWIGGRRWTWAAATVVGVLLACVPWGWRNYATFGELFFVRRNVGLELRMGNSEGAAADLDTLDYPGSELRHPRTHLAEARLLQEVGEIAYMRRARREAIEWIHTHPAAFLRLTAQRACYFWLGSPSQGGLAVASALLTILAALGLWRAWPTIAAPQRAAVLVPLLTFPLTYYLVVFLPRYGAPLTGLLLLLSGVELWRWLAGPTRASARVRSRPPRTAAS